MSSIATHATRSCCGICTTNGGMFPVDVIPASLALRLEHELVHAVYRLFRTFAVVFVK
jgi:hypothetical protein